jgi:predicted Zn finger-like uncharacterized protein
MDVRCERCGTEYELDDESVPDGGVPVQCTTCGNTFAVSRAVAESAASGTPPTAAEWLLETSDGRLHRFRNLTSLQKWIIERKVTRDDKISRTGHAWRRLGEIVELGPFFDVVDEADRAKAGQAGALEREATAGLKREAERARAASRSPSPLPPRPVPPPPRAEGIRARPRTDEVPELLDEPSTRTMEVQTSVTRPGGFGGKMAVVLAIVAGAGIGVFFFGRTPPPAVVETARVPTPAPPVVEPVAVPAPLAATNPGAAVVAVAEPAAPGDAVAAVAGTEETRPEGPGTAPAAGTDVAETATAANDEKPVTAVKPGAPSGQVPAGHPPASAGPEPGLSYERLVASADKLLENGATDKAKRIYEQALRLAPRGVEAQTGLGWVMLDKARTGQAVGFFREALARSPSFGPALYGMAEAQRAAGDERAALASYQKYVATNPSGIDVHAARRQIRALEEKMNAGEDRAPAGPPPAPSSVLREAASPGTEPGAAPPP